MTTAKSLSKKKFFCATCGQEKSRTGRNCKKCHIDFLAKIKSERYGFSREKVINNFKKLKSNDIHPTLKMLAIQCEISLARVSEILKEEGLTLNKCQGCWARLDYRPKSGFCKKCLK